MKYHTKLKSETASWIFFVFFTFMRRVNNLTCDFVPTSSMVIKNKHKSLQSIITDNWDISRLEHNLIFWMNVHRMTVPRNPEWSFPDHNKRVWIKKGLEEGRKRQRVLKDGLPVTGSVWVKRKCSDYVTIERESPCLTFLLTAFLLT